MRVMYLHCVWTAMLRTFTCEEKMKSPSFVTAVILHNYSVMCPGLNVCGWLGVPFYKFQLVSKAGVKSS